MQGDHMSSERQDPIQFCRLLDASAAQRSEAVRRNDAALILHARLIMLEREWQDRLHQKTFSAEALHRMTNSRLDDWAASLLTGQFSLTQISTLNLPYLFIRMVVNYTSAQLAQNPESPSTIRRSAVESAISAAQQLLDRAAEWMARDDLICAPFPYLTVRSLCRTG